MKKFTMPLAVAALVVAYVGSASAQPCPYNVGANAKGVRGSMVRNFAPCPGTEHPISNTSTQGGTDACTPATPPTVDGNATPYLFSSKGKCNVTTQAKLVKDCSALTNLQTKASLGLPSAPCHVTYVSSKCSGIVQDDGTTPIGSTDDGWSLATLSRATVDDQSNGEMTIIDFPVTFIYSTPDKGKMEVKSSSAQALVPLVGASAAALPPCTSIEVVNVVIKDPDNLPFAKLGGSTIPK